MSNFNVAELNNLFKQIDQIGGNNSGSTGLGQVGQSYNDIAWFAGAVGDLGSENATPEQKASVVQGMVDKALSILDKLMNKEAQQAKRDVQKNTQAAQAVLERSQKLESVLNGSLSEIQTNIESQTQIVADAQELIEKNQEAIEAKQKQIEEITQKIEEKRNELAAAEPEKQAEILAEIQALGLQIAEIVSSIQEDNEVYQNLEKAVTDTTQDVEALTEKLAATGSEGIQQLATQAQEAFKVNGNIVKTSVEGGTNKVTGETLEKTAEAASSNLFTGASIAPKLYMAANDQKLASSTRLTSIAGNVNKLAQGIGGLNNATQVLETFQNSIGGALSDYSSIIGEWDATVNPVIESIGSIAAVSAGVEELNTAVTTDLVTLGYSVSQEGEVEKNEQAQDNALSEQPEQKENANKGAELETVKFDTKKLRTFGI